MVIKRGTFQVFFKIYHCLRHLLVMNELMEVVYLFLENQMLIIFLCNKIKKKTFSKEENSSFNPQKAEFPDF